jgi:diaminopimelate epimerase
MKFTKMHGTGNDFIVVEDFNNEIGDKQCFSIKLCDRHFGIGADGVLFVEHSKKADVGMLIINSDGSYAGMCGNGIRCFAKYVWENNIIKKKEMNIETGDGIKSAVLGIKENKVESITINMGKPSFDPKSIPATSSEEIINKTVENNGKSYNITSLLMGVPHTIIFGNLDDYDVKEGAILEKHSMFPLGTNVNLCEIETYESIRVKTWERGAGATLACGTGCCACVVAGNKLGLLGSYVKVKIPGGELIIELSDDVVKMTGPAVAVFTGDIDINNLV